MITISPIEVLALKKLCLINHALADSLSLRPSAQSEQRALVQVLNDITLRASVDNEKAER